MGKLVQIRNKSSNRADEYAVEVVSGDASVVALELASNAEMITGSNTNKVITPGSLAQAITADKLANGVGWAALLTAGLGNSANYAKTTNGAQTLLASNVAARVALIVVTVTENFADGDGGQTVFTIGETSSASKYCDGTLLANASAGTIKILAGTLTATKNLIVTGTPATGTGTGAISVMAMVLPASA